MVDILAIYEAVENIESDWDVECYALAGLV
jgi:hypothetical protein